ncbi:MAG: ATP-binding protein, partial [Deltaproteobacteria bacterium]|nr:ATP-binding protein [Deltaproteobacteria bacterium]
VAIHGGRTYLVDLIPIKIDNKPYGRLWYHIDISERKRAEQERENLRAQLLQSQKMETMGTLAAGIAHDFNNMLTVILGYSSMLLADKNEKDPGYEGLQKILKTSQDAADLVQRIRIFGRKAEMNLIPLDLNHQINQATKLLSRTLPKMIEMDIHLAKDPVIIRADPSQITQMVMNLAVNANEAMPQGGRLSILTENIVLDDDYCRLLMGVKPGPHVMLTVSDTGRGIDKSLMERIFDPFYSTKARDYRKGTGLGLSVVQGIVQQHGGHITVESEVGQGTTFRMYFPALEVEKVPEYVEWKIPYPAGGTETILLVTVLSACDGQEALEVYEKEQGNIALVILDIIMPRMDGKQCLEQLLRINPTVKVIISSGVGYYDLINEVVEIGAKGAVNKPYSMRQILGMVRQVLDGD